MVSLLRLYYNRLKSPKANPNEGKEFKLPKAANQDGEGVTH